MPRGEATLCSAAAWSRSADERTCVRGHDPSIACGKIPGNPVSDAPSPDSSEASTLDPRPSPDSSEASTLDPGPSPDSSEASTLDPRPSRRTMWLRLFVVLLSLAVGLSIVEGVLRSRIHVDADGNQTAFGARLAPFAAPVEWTRSQATKLAGGRNGCFRYDSDLGWTSNPRTRCRKGRYVYDSAGIRTSSVRRTPSRRPEPGVLRIGLFGDSFTHGDDVAHKDSWGHVLEQTLQQRGVRAEVFNFGVGGYGIDQALLRWRKQGTGFGLDVVVLGFQSENILRNLNMLRVLYWWRTRLPFTKPRFIERDGELVVINQPTVGPDELPTVLADLPGWALVEHEGFYDPADFEPRWWHASRVLGYFAVWKAHEVGRLWYSEQAQYYALDSPAAQLALRIIETFEHEVREAGSAFYLVHLPKAFDVDRLVADPASLSYADLRDELARRHTWVETGEAFVAARQSDPEDPLFFGREHYTPRGNQVVALAVADALALLAAP